MSQAGSTPWIHRIASVLAPLSLAVAVATFAACSNTNHAHDAGIGDVHPADASNGAGNPSMDMATPTSTDMAVTTSTDMASPMSTDMATPTSTDMAMPVVLGINWPPDQIFPSFAPPGKLDVVEIQGRPDDILTLTATLQGMVNRTQPRIYISGGQPDLWLTELNVPSTTVSDPLTLITKYRSEISGMVIYDDTLPDTLNLATTVAGVQGGVAASPALSTTLAAAPYNLPVLLDLRTFHFASKLDVYNYELANYTNNTNHRLIIGLQPDHKWHLRDYAVANKALTVWLDPDVTAEAQLLDQFLNLLPPNAPYLGWWTDEGAGVHQAATHAVPVYAADWSSNLTVLGGAPRGSKPPAAPPPPHLEKKMYVAIFMSDGDNLQEDQGLVPLKWSDANRGSVPISWTLDPALIDVAPVILRYFQRTGTLNDLLVSGPSGLGYTYPSGWPGGVFDQYAQVSGKYLANAGFRVVTVWNNGADLSATDAQSYATHAPSLLGLTMQDSTTALQFINNSLPVLRMALSYGDNESIIESGIDGQLATFNGTAPLFVAVQGNMNQGSIQPTAFANVQNHYVNNTNVVFLRADHLFRLLSQAQFPAAHRAFSGDFNGDGKTDSLFYYSGDGNWWMGLSDGTQLNWQVAGNTANLGNLLDPSRTFYQGDFNGDGKTDMLFYFNGDGNWWMGISDGSKLTWHKAGNSTTMGNLLDGKHRISTGDYNKDGKTDLLVYGATDGVWWLGASDGNAITWQNAGSTSGFGNLLDGSHAFYDGDFDGDGRADVLFYYNGDKNLWLGRSDGATLTWSGVGNTNGFGNLLDNGHKLVAADFNGDHRTDLLFYYSGDGNWWLGASTGSAFNWSNVANTSALGNFIDLNHHLFPVDLNGDGKTDVLVQDSGTGNWEVGVSNGTSLTWQKAGDSATLGDVADPTRLLFFGDYDGDGTVEPLCYTNNDGNWWMSRAKNALIGWHQAGNVSGFGDLTR